MDKKEASNMAPSELDKSIQRSAEAAISNYQSLLKQYQKRPDEQLH